MDETTTRDRERARLLRIHFDPERFEGVESVFDDACVREFAAVRAEERAAATARLATIVTDERRRSRDDLDVGFVHGVAAALAALRGRADDGA